MKATEENKEELLKQYINDIYVSTRYVIPRNIPSMETIGRFSHQRLVSQYALTLEYVLRVQKVCDILLKILDNRAFKQFNLEKFDKHYERMTEKARKKEHQEYLEQKEARKRFAQYRRDRKKTSNQY